MTPKVQIIDISETENKHSASPRSIIYWAQKNRLISVFGTLAVLFFFSGLYIIWRDNFSQPDKNVQIIPTDSANTISESGGSVSGGGIYVDLSGAVQKPGLYHLPATARINDLLVAAGGLSAEADREWFNKSINLAQKLQDGVKIFIPFQNHKLNTINQKQEEGSTFGLATGKININLASKTELESLPKIGPATAQKIIDYRHNNGPFSVIEDLKKVSGIGDKTFEELKELITVY